MKNIYAAALYAADRMFGRAVKTATVAATIVATSLEEAQSRAMAIAYETFPARLGWGEHSVSVVGATPEQIHDVAVDRYLSKPEANT